MLPMFARRLAVSSIEYAWKMSCIKKENASVREFINKIERDYSRREAKKEGEKTNVLFYHISGLSFGGTEKSLQAIAKHMDKRAFNVHFAYGNRTGSPVQNSREHYLAGSGVELIKTDYAFIEPKKPFYISGMTPSLPELILAKDIDVIVTATSGHAEFPLNVIPRVPILNINIFGSFCLQKNIARQLCISHEVAEKAAFVIPKEKLEVLYIQSERPAADRAAGIALRAKLGIPDDAFVFGRIGRADNGIFDPIALDAFRQVAEIEANAYFLIMSPAPIAVEKVKAEGIPRVIFLAPSPAEFDIFSFHQALDVLAHSRHDGESCGLNIIESMMCGNPIITHRSHIWNAHLEYLDDSFSRVAPKDDPDAYASHMNELVELRRSHSQQFQTMQANAKEKAEKLFLIDNSIGNIENIIRDAASLK